MRNIKADKDLIWFLRILTCLAIIPVQTIFLEPFQIFGVKPDLALILVFVQGWFWGAPNGLYWGLSLGVLLDLFSVGTVGLDLILKALVGATAGFFGKSLFHLSIQVYVAIFLIISLLHDVTGTLILRGLGTEGFQAIQTEDIIIRALYNAVLGIVSVFLIRNRINRQEIQSYGGAIFSPGKR